MLTRDFIRASPCWRPWRTHVDYNGNEGLGMWRFSFSQCIAFYFMTFSYFFRVFLSSQNINRTARNEFREMYFPFRYFIGVLFIVTLMLRCYRSVWFDCFFRRLRFSDQQQRRIIIIWIHSAEKKIPLKMEEWSHRVKDWECWFCSSYRK